MSNLLEERTFQSVVNELQLANPKANITANATGDGIISNRSALRLDLPRDFYVTRNGGISNRGNTESGEYLFIGVEVKNTELSQQPKLRKLNILGSLKQKLLTPKAQMNTNDREM